MRPDPTARPPWLLALAVAALALGAHAGVLANDFVNYDDDLYVTDRSEVLAGLTWEGVRWAFTTFQGANWFPLTRLSWMLDAELYGPEPRGFHATSLALHALAAALLFLALERLSRQRWPSAFAAAVFAVHPLHVECVAWVSARKDVLAAVCFAAVLLLHERRVRGGHPRAWGAAVAAVLALGLMAKPMLVTLPCLLLLLDAWPLLRFGPPDRAAKLRAALREKLPLFALAAGVGVATVLAQREGGALQGLEPYPFGVRVQAALDGVAALLARAFWPVDLAVFHPHPRDTLPLWRTLLVAALLAAATAAAWAQHKRRPHLAVGWLWFAGMLVPVSGLVQVGQAATADRYAYLPLVGVSIAVAWSARELAARARGARVAVCVAGLAAIAVLAWLTTAQVQTWRDSRSLFEHALGVTERNHVAHINLGLELARAGEIAPALRQLDAAVALVPDSPLALGLRGEVRLTARSFDAAASDLRRAQQLEPDAARWRVARARALAASGQGDAALDVVRGALALHPADGPANAMLGDLLQQRDPAAAVAAYRAALAAGERSALVLNNLAWILATHSDPALRDRETAARLAREALEKSGGDDPAIRDTLRRALSN